MDDIKIAQRYVSKAQRAKAKGIPFELSFTAFKNMMRAKYCFYSGVELTEPDSSILSATARTIDRIDNSKGYVSGNVCACSNAANNFKSLLEGPDFALDKKTIVKLINASGLK